MEIKEIARIIPGYAFRGAIEPNEGGNVSLFQAKNLVQGESFVDVDSLTKISGNFVFQTYELKKDDVLLVVRGMSPGAFRSTVFMSDASNVIASSSIYIIRITVPAVLPEYLSHYLNSKEGQDALSQIVTGSYIGALPRKELEKIEIPIPPPEKQKALVELHQNLQQQRRIMDRRNALNQEIINAAFKTLTAV